MCMLQSLHCLMLYAMSSVLVSKAWDVGKEKKGKKTEVTGASRSLIYWLYLTLDVLLCYSGKGASYRRLC